MKKNINNLAFAFLLFPFVLSVSSLKANNDEEQTCCKHVHIASRSLSTEEREELATEREAQKEEGEDDSAAEEKNQKKDLFSNDFYQLHYAAFHKLIAMACDGSSIDLDDGSRWSLCYSIDTWLVQNWTMKDSIVIEQWDSFGLEYKILNQTRNEYVIAVPVLGPIYLGINTHWITKITSSGKVTLEDGSEWDAFSSSDVYRWNPGDTVILGGYNGGVSYNTIIINVNVLSYTRAKLLHQK